MATDQAERTQTLVDAPPVQQGPEGEGRSGSGVGRLGDLRIRWLSNPNGQLLRRVPHINKLIKLSNLILAT